jgi:hypothetical protein
MQGSQQLEQVGQVLGLLNSHQSSNTIIHTTNTPPTNQVMLPLLLLPQLNRPKLATSDR